MDLQISLGLSTLPVNSVQMKVDSLYGFPTSNVIILVMTIAGILGKENHPTYTVPSMDVNQLDKSTYPSRLNTRIH